MSGARRAPVPEQAAIRVRERRLAIGTQVGDARMRRRWTQAQLGERAGIGRMVVGRVERGTARLDMEILERLALALGITLTVALARDPHEDVADAGHLAIQELILRLARRAGLNRRLELATRPNEPWRSADVGIGSPAQRAAADIECWNTLGDIGAGVRSSTRKVAELSELAVAAWGSSGRASLCWVVRATARNREILARHPEVFAGQFPASSSAWIAALTRGGPIPRQAGLVWCDVRSTRLFAWRRPALSPGRGAPRMGRAA